MSDDDKTDAFIVLIAIASLTIAAVVAVSAYYGGPGP